MDFKHFVLLVIIGGAWCQTTPSISELLDKLPADYQGKVNATQIEDIANKTETVFREKCDKNGGPDIYPKVKGAITKLPDCVKSTLGISNPEILKAEIEDAKPNGTVDEVFKKYCAKSPEVRGCFTNLLELSKPCFTVDERKNLNIVQNITEQLVDFVCFKDGDRIALFIAEGGPECYQEKSEEIQECMQKMAPGTKINTTDLSANSIPEFSFDAEECQKIADLQTCVVTALEECQTPTSANIVESLFKFVRKATPCKEFESRPGGGATGLYVTTATIAIAAVATLLL